MASSTSREAARRVAVYVHNLIRAGHAKRRRRVPRPQWPFAIEREYASDLVAIITDLRRQTDAVLVDLPALLDSAARERHDAAELLVDELVGLRIVIESPAGSVREWTDADGASGRTVMRWSYGYLDGFGGADGEDVDVYKGPEQDPSEVFVIHQRRKGAPDAEDWPIYDEDKVMLGWSSADAAKAAYLEQYDDPRFFGGMSVFTVDDFKRRLHANPGRKLTHADPRERVLRTDVGEGRRSRVLMDRARDGLSASGSRAERAAESAARQVGDHQKRQLARQSAAALGVDITPLLADPKWAARIDGFVHENVALVESLGRSTLGELEKMITRALADGRRAEALGAEIAKRWGIAERHARLIARDQIGKLNGQITRARHEELGIARFRWLTMRDPRVRPRHRPMEGKVFAYVGKGAPPFFPGQEICCRCGEEPVFDDIMAELDALLAGGQPQLAPASALAVAPPSKWQPPARAPPIQVAPAAPRSSVVLVKPATPAPLGEPIPPAPMLAAGGGGGRRPPPRGGGGAAGPPGGGGGGGTPREPRQWRRANARGLGELEQRSIVSTKALGGGVNQTFVATLDDQTKAVWKPVTGEDPGLRSNIKAGSYYKREAAAAKVAEQLGVSDLMPATVEHAQASGRGSLQAFANGARALGSNVPAFDRDSSERMRVFDFVVGNTDRHQGNVLQLGRRVSRPVLIDHGLCFPSGPPDRFIQPWTHIDRTTGPLLPSTLEQVKKIDLQHLAKTLLDSGIDEAAVKHTLYRAQLIKLRPALLEVPSTGGGVRAWDQTGATAHMLLPAPQKQAVDAIVAAHRRTP